MEDLEQENNYLKSVTSDIESTLQSYVIQLEQIHKSTQEVLWASCKEHLSAKMVHLAKQEQQNIDHKHKDKELNEQHLYNLNLDSEKYHSSLKRESSFISNRSSLYSTDWADYEISVPSPNKVIYSINLCRNN